MIDLGFLKRYGAWLTAGVLMTFASSFGQTFYIAIFGGEIRAAFGLSHGDFGGLYTIATLCSAGTLIWIGVYADRLAIRWLAALTLISLAFACLIMASVASIWMLLLALYSLRLFGQGMLSHLAMTAMARWFEGFRGRAIGIAVLGHPLGEATLPLISALVMVWIGWRATWVSAAGFLVLVILPFMLYLLRKEPGLAAAPDEALRATSAPRLPVRRQWMRREVLRDPFLYLLLPGILAPAFINTAIFFHQVHLVEVKGWSLTWFIACYPFTAIATSTVSLVTGWAIDRFGSDKLLPLFLLPQIAGTTVLALFDTPLIVPAYMLLAGSSMGATTPVIGAILAELYGTRHLGAIRAMVVACMVLASALGPGIVGWLIDLDVDLGRQLLAMAAYTLVGTLLFVISRPRLKAALRWQAGSVER